MKKMAKLPKKPGEPKHGGPVLQHGHLHPLHAVDTDPREMSLKEKYLGNGPNLPMPKHQHDLHHPHTDVSEVHRAHHMVNPK